MDAGTTVRQARRRQGLSQLALGQKLEVSKQHVSAIELGLRNPSYLVAVSLCKILHLPFDLFDGQTATEIDS